MKWTRGSGVAMLGALTWLVFGCSSSASTVVKPGDGSGGELMGGSGGDDESGRGGSGGGADSGRGGSGGGADSIRGGSAGMGDDASSGAGGEDSGPFECEPEETQECWETPEGAPLPNRSRATQGDCRLGVRTCSASGEFGACEGAVAPRAQDSCEPGADENCNGTANEGCPCETGETRPCGSSTGNCQPGTQRCEDGAWSDCEGGVAPQAEDSCEVADDDADCDGVPNGGCPCIADQSEQCNDCGTRTCDPAARAWGPCTAAQDPLEARCAADVKAIETCGENGRWVPTECTSASPRCTEECVLANGAPRCVVRAADVDGDEHGDALCSAAPGDDCDDTNRAVYTGAAEVCDGVDNNCNGRADLNDGLSLSGSNRTVTGRVGLDVTWNPSTSRFGLVGNSSDTSKAGIYFATLSGSGALELASDALTIASEDTVRHTSARIAYSPAYGGSGGGFGVVYRAGGKSGIFQNWLYVSGAGTPGTQFTLSSRAEPGGIATRANGQFLATFTTGSPSSLEFGRIQDTVGYTDASTLEEAARDPRIAANGAGSAIVFQLAGLETIRWVRANSSLVLGTPQTLVNGGTNPDIAAIPGGYAIAWRTAAGLTFRAFDTGGAPLCGPTSVTFGNGMIDPVNYDGIAVESTAYGTVVLATDTGSAPRLFRFNAACALVDQAELQRGATASSMPNAAVGGGSLVLTWNDYPGTVATVRILNEALCE